MPFRVRTQLRAIWKTVRKIGGLVESFLRPSRCEGNILGEIRRFYDLAGRAACVHYSPDTTDVDNCSSSGHIALKAICAT
jgi:hypothetical protein